MDELFARLPQVINLLVPLLFFMAWVYLGLHILFARLVANPRSPVLWFFDVVTGPLTRPVRTLLAPGTPERRVRIVSFAVYVGLWLVARVVLAQLLGPSRG
jgi:hypothetical protein